jgi:hypothetical protein
LTAPSATQILTINIRISITCASAHNSLLTTHNWPTRPTGLAF